MLLNVISATFGIFHGFDHLIHFPAGWPYLVHLTPLSFNHLLGKITKKHWPHRAIMRDWWDKAKESISTGSSWVLFGSSVTLICKGTNIPSSNQYVFSEHMFWETSFTGCWGCNVVAEILGFFTQETHAPFFLGLGAQVCAYVRKLVLWKDGLVFLSREKSWLIRANHLHPLHFGLMVGPWLHLDNHIKGEVGKDSEKVSKETWRDKVLSFPSDLLGSGCEGWSYSSHSSVGREEKKSQGIPVFRGQWKEGSRHGDWARYEESQRNSFWNPTNHFKEVGLTQYCFRSSKMSAETWPWAWQSEKSPFQGSWGKSLIGEGWGEERWGNRLRRAERWVDLMLGPWRGSSWAESPFSVELEVISWA